MRRRLIRWLNVVDAELYAARARARTARLLNRFAGERGWRARLFVWRQALRR